MHACMYVCMYDWLGCRDERSMHVVDIVSGKGTGGPMVHGVEVRHISIDQTGPLLARLCAFIDKVVMYILAYFK